MQHQGKPVECRTALVWRSCGPWHFEGNVDVDLSAYRIVLRPSPTSKHPDHVATD
jgi:hypothetical protein